MNEYRLPLPARRCYPLLTLPGMVAALHWSTHTRIMLACWPASARHRRSVAGATAKRNHAKPRSHSIAVVQDADRY
jgi:hypothetical protein